MATSAEVIQQAHDTFVQENGEDFRIDTDQLTFLAQLLEALREDSRNSWELLIFADACALLLKEYTDKVLQLPQDEIQRILAQYTTKEEGVA